ncbi:hypothetical protein [Kitasatospora sp. HPMI-4]|uniref:hypothetical protein n=1 Tax=Kitasatospora sp. HPMI-4 TaxID=3448443 RepID=UPI003F1D9F73
MPQQREQGESQDAEPPATRRARIDLSVAQVAASALAAVVGAVLASELGVYGTILGAAVVSIGATTGGAVFQHLFRRTGEQIRSAVDRGPGVTVNDLRQVPADGAVASPMASPVISPEWNEPQTVRAKRRWTWKTYSAVSGLIFVLAMTPILAVELIADKPMHSIVTGDGSSSGTSLNPGRRSEQPPPADHPSGGSAGTDPSTVPSRHSTGTPETVPSDRHTPSATPSQNPSGTPSSSPMPSSGPSTTPDPSPSSGTGSDPGTFGDQRGRGAETPPAAPTP